MLSVSPFSIKLVTLAALFSQTVWENLRELELLRPKSFNSLCDSIAWVTSTLQNPDHNHLFQLRCLRLSAPGLPILPGLRLGAAHLTASDMPLHAEFCHITRYPVPSKSHSNAYLSDAVSWRVMRKSDGGSQPLPINMLAACGPHRRMIT